jgi:hypothetical protein
MQDFQTLLKLFVEFAKELIAQPEQDDSFYPTHSSRLVRRELFLQPQSFKDALSQLNTFTGTECEIAFLKAIEALELTKIKPDSRWPELYQSLYNAAYSDEYAYELLQAFSRDVRLPENAELVRNVCSKTQLAELLFDRKGANTLRFILDESMDIRTFEVYVRSFDKQIGVVKDAVWGADAGEPIFIGSILAMAYGAPMELSTNFQTYREVLKTLPHWDYINEAFWLKWVHRRVVIKDPTREIPQWARDAMDSKSPDFFYEQVRAGNAADIIQFFGAGLYQQRVGLLLETLQKQLRIDLTPTDPELLPLARVFWQTLIDHSVPDYILINQRVHKYLTTLKCRQDFAEQIREEERKKLSGKVNHLKQTLKSTLDDLEEPEDGAERF